ncbi:MAG: ribosomal-processing cysteine protease Prp [Clostridiales bacterium]|nr:ribosomal-processing cysteine protease Prp [Clostridiales bacterium]
MTTVTVRYMGNGISSLSVKGHADYAEYGQDIVCAAASVLITTCANALESVAGVSPITHVDERTAEIRVSLPDEHQQSHDAQIILRTTLQGFQDIAQQYPKNLQII